jgi:MFS transporter, FHS family, glucose/mannose:H+ symporter
VLRLIRFHKDQWVLFFSCTTMFVFGLADNIRGPLFADLMDFFKLTNTQGSLSFAATSAAALVGNVLSAHLLKHMTLARLLIFSLFLMALGLLFMGLASSFNLYLVSAIIFGLSLGLMTVAQNLIVAESIEPEKQSKALSGLHGLYGLSSLLAPILASRAPEFFGPWRSAFFVTSSIALVILLISFLIRPEPGFTIEEHRIVEDKDKPSWSLLFSFGGIFAFYVVAEILVSTRLALYMRTYFNMNLEQSSNYVTYFFIFLLVGRVFFAFKAFAASLKSQLTISLLVSILFLVLGLTVNPFFLALVGLSMAPFYPLSVAYISRQTGAEKRKFITFAISFQSFCVITMHIGVGYLTDRFGLFYAFGVGIVSLVLSLLCVNLHPRVSSPKLALP